MPLMLIALAAAATIVAPDGRKVYQYDKGMGRFVFAVTGSETLKTPAGLADAWVVAVDTGSPTRASYLIDKRDGAELGTCAGPFITRSVACGPASPP